MYASTFLKFGFGLGTFPDQLKLVRKALDLVFKKVTIL